MSQRTLRGIRLDKGLTAQALADASGLTAESITDIEDGRVAKPRDKTIIAIANALEMKPSEILSLFAEQAA